MNSEEKDGKLFHKYQPANDNLFENLENNQLYFRDPRDYNDPLDSIVKSYLKATKDKWIDYINKLEPGYNISNLAEVMIDGHLNEGIFRKEGDLIVQDTPLKKYEYRPLTCCLSKEYDNILMWSHYANGHKGVCLSFKSKYKPMPELKHTPEYALTVNSEPSPLYPMTYDIKMPDPINLVDDFLDDTRLLFDFLLTKSTSWHYEQEHRMFLVEPKTQNKAEFEKEELEGVIFGLKVNYGDARTILKIIEKYYQGIPIKFYKTQPTDGKYSIEKVEVDIDKIDDYVDSLALYDECN